MRSKRADLQRSKAKAAAAGVFVLAAALVCGALTLPVNARAAASDAEPGPVVRTHGGRLQGVVQDGVASYLGVPYAQPPVGNLRWRPPKLRAKWAGVRPSTSFAPGCAMITTLGVFAGPPNANEDCLYLNIFAPVARPAQNRPVIVFVHGGGNFAGSAEGYDGRPLASRGDVIVVTVQYRLNLFGFMAHPALDAEGHPFANYGLLDQQAALKWVRQNIAAFGGNRNNVTLAGQSAGALDTMANLVSPLARGLFDRAICQSACPANYQAVPLRAAEATGLEFAKAAGCEASSAPATAECLRGLPASKIVELAGTAQAPSRFVLSAAVVDGRIVPDQPSALIQSGHFNRVPVMNGTTRDEVNFTLAISEYWSGPDNTRRKPVTAIEYRSYLATAFAPPKYSADAAAEIWTLYSPMSVGSPQAAWNRAATDARACDVRELVGALARYVPVYPYQFVDGTAPSYFPDMPGLELKAYHTGDIQYLFPGWHGGPDGVERPLSEGQQQLSQALMTSWANFARSGNPNGARKGSWQSFNAQISPAWTIQGPPGLSSMPDAEYASLHRCDFWNSVAASPVHGS